MLLLGGSSRALPLVVAMIGPRAARHRPTAQRFGWGVSPVHVAR